MRTIWKFQIRVGDYACITMPKGAVILCVQMQNKIPCIWVECSTDAPVNEKRYFEYFGTGHLIPPGDREYIGTIQLFDGSEIYHLYERNSLL